LGRPRSSTSTSTANRANRAKLVRQPLYMAKKPPIPTTEALAEKDHAHEQADLPLPLPGRKDITDDGQGHGNDAGGKKGRHRPPETQPGQGTGQGATGGAERQAAHDQPEEPAFAVSVGEKSRHGLHEAVGQQIGRQHGSGRGHGNSESGGHGRQKR